MTQVVEREKSSTSSSTTGTYEYVRNADGTITKVTPFNSNGRKCGKCGCRCPCSCADCKPFCCSGFDSRSKIVDDAMRDLFG